MAFGKEETESEKESDQVSLKYQRGSKKELVCSDGISTDATIALVYISTRQQPPNGGRAQV